MQIDRAREPVRLVKDLKVLVIPAHDASSLEVAQQDCRTKPEDQSQEAGDLLKRILHLAARFAIAARLRGGR